MAESNTLQDEVNRILESIEQEQESAEQPPAQDFTEGQETPELETFHIYIFREGAEEPQEDCIVESTLVSEGQPAEPVTEYPKRLRRTPYSVRNTVLELVFVLVCLVVSVGVLFISILPSLTPNISITITPTEKQISMATTIQTKARLLPSLTLSQTKTVPATGTRHQNAESAVGTITFFNGLFTSQTIAAGTTLTASNGAQVVTDQATFIPAGNPPMYGEVTVPAHALFPGVQGNIPARSINTACCSTSVLAQNLVSFQGGLNAQDYTIVTQQDISAVVVSVKQTLTRSELAALNAQIQPNEGLITPSCSIQTISDHQPGAQATQVTVTVLQSCKGVAYAMASLQNEATQVYTSQAVKMLGAGYVPLGDFAVHVLHGSMSDLQPDTAKLTVRVDGAWVYQFSEKKQEQLIRLIAGKSRQEAISMLRAMPGIQRSSIAKGDNGALPEAAKIRLIFVIPAV